MGKGDEWDGRGTDLCPYHLCQGADELWCCCSVEAKGFLVDDLADGEPEGGFEALENIISQLMQSVDMYQTQDMGGVICTSWILSSIWPDMMSEAGC